MNPCGQSVTLWSEHALQVYVGTSCGSMLTLTVVCAGTHLLCGSQQAKCLSVKSALTGYLRGQRLWVRKARPSGWWWGICENSSALNSDFLSWAALFFKTEIDNLLLNFTWNKIQSMSIECCRKWSTPILHTSTNTAQSPKRATDLERSQRRQPIEEV